MEATEERGLSNELINIDHGTQLFHLSGAVRNVFLVSKSRIYGHQKYHIHFLQKVIQLMQRSRRVQCNTGFLSQLMDLLDRTVRMFAGLCMDRDDIRPACRCLFDITLPVNF